jgi:hypothetical protein
MYSLFDFSLLSFFDFGWVGGQNKISENKLKLRFQRYVSFLNGGKDKSSQ